MWEQFCWVTHRLLNVNIDLKQTSQFFHILPDGCCAGLSAATTLLHRSVRANTLKQEGVEPHIGDRVNYLV